VREKPPSECADAQKPSSRLSWEFIGDSSLAVTLPRGCPAAALQCRVLQYTVAGFLHTGCIPLPEAFAPVA
jgi:hypothetical protein